MNNLFLSLGALLLCSGCLATSGDVARIEDSVQAQMAEVRDGTKTFEQAVDAIKGEVRGVAGDIQQRGKAFKDGLLDAGMALLLGGGALAGRKRIAAGVKTAASAVNKATRSDES